MYYGGGQATKYSPTNTPLPHPFVSLFLRGETEGMVLKGGDATRGAFTTMYAGERPLCSIAGTCMRHGNHTYQVRLPTRRAPCPAAPAAATPPLTRRAPPTILYN